jgi:predicted phage-related endonuclease
MHKGLKINSTKNMSEKDWQTLRQSFSTRGMVGGSDAGTLLGWNKWKSPITLYYQALGLSPLSDKMNIEMLMGKLQEDNIAYSWQFYDKDPEKFIQNAMSKTKTRTYKQVKGIVENPAFPCLFANLDGVITKHPVKGRKKGVLEIKKINGISYDSYIGGIPPQYLAQVQHYMMVCELDYAELCMRVDGKHLAVELIESDYDIQEKILIEAHRFHARVQAARDAILTSGTKDQEEMLGFAATYEPDADGSEDFDAFISAKHKAREPESIMIASAEHDDWAVQYSRYSKLLKKVEERKLLYSNRLKQAMEKESANQMILTNGKINWRKQFQLKLNNV